MNKNTSEKKWRLFSNFGDVRKLELFGYDVFRKVFRKKKQWQQQTLTNSIF